MRELNQVEWHAGLRKGFECVFWDADPFEAPLRHSVMHRALLYRSSYVFTMTTGSDAASASLVDVADVTEVTD